MTSLASRSENPIRLHAQSGRGGRRRRTAPLIPGGLRWVIPALIVSVGLIYYSIVYSGYLSFFDWSGGRAPMKPVGFDNYVQAFTDPVFWIAIRNTAIYFVVVFAVQVIGGVMFAAALHSRVFLGNVYKVIIVIPVVALFVFMQKRFIEGMAGGSVKG